MPSKDAKATDAVDTDSDISADRSVQRIRKRPSAVNGAPLTEPTKSEPPKQKDLLGGSLAYAIKRTQVRCDEALSRYLDEGISPARFAALSTVGANPGISQATLGGFLNIAGPSVVKVVDELERLGLLTREKTSDRRVYALMLTERGISDLKRFNSSVQTFEKKIAALLTQQERAQLLALLAKVAPDEA